MILLTNGCSWTWGGSLGLDGDKNDKIRQQLVWPHHLGKLLNTDETIQLALGCGSNQRILRTTLDWILNQTPEKLSQTVAVIQWTELSRFEYYNPNDPTEYYENYPERWARAKIDCIMDAFEPDVEKSLKRVNSRLETYTEIEGLYRNIFECSALHDIFTRFNIKYYYWRYGNYYPKAPAHLTNFLESYNWFKDSHAWEYGRISDQDRHPSFSGHKDIANIIYNKIKENVS